MITIFFNMIISYPSMVTVNNNERPDYFYKS